MPGTYRTTSATLIISWSFISSCVTTVIACGTSRIGVRVFVALLVVAARYPAGALTVTSSRTAAMVSTNGWQTSAAAGRDRQQLRTIDEPGATTVRV